MGGVTLLALNPNFPCLSCSLVRQLLMCAHTFTHAHIHTGLILDLIAAQLIILKGGGGEEVRKRDVLGEGEDWGWGTRVHSVRPRQPLERA